MYILFISKNDEMDSCILTLGCKYKLNLYIPLVYIVTKFQLYRLHKSIYIVLKLGFTDI